MIKSSSSRCIPVDARDLLPAGHRVWSVLELVGQLDVSAFTAVYRADVSALK